jgi:hypothetical protein
MASIIARAKYITVRSVILFTPEPVSEQNWWIVMLFVGQDVFHWKDYYYYWDWSAIN